MNKEFLMPLRVYIEDTDAGGIVFYVNYLKYMERARTEFFRLLGFDKPAIIQDGLLLVVATANVRYLAPAKLDDALNVSARINKFGHSYIVFEQKVLRDGKCLCLAEIKIACVNKNQLKPTALPAEVKSAFNQYLGSST